MKRLPIFPIVILVGMGAVEVPFWSYSKALALSPLMPVSEQLAQAEPRPGQPLNPASLEQRAQALYETGRFVDAVALLQQLVVNYESQGDRLSQARALRNLALVYHQTSELAKGSDALNQSLILLKGLENTSETAKLFAQILEIQGQLELSAGHSEKALEIWQQAAGEYQKIGDEVGRVRSQINQAQALQVLGLYSQAVKTLKTVRDTLQNQSDLLLKAKGLQSLGDALRVVGDLEQSQDVLQQSLAIAEQLSSPDVLVATLISLGNNARVQNQPELANNLYQRAVQESTSPLNTIKAQLNRLSLLVDQRKWPDAKQLAPQIQSVLEPLPASRAVIYARINLANNWLKIATSEPSSRPITPSVSQNTAKFLAIAVQQAQSLQDQRAEAYALGHLGKLYEQQKQWQDARKVTEKALLLAQSVNAADIAYQWQWQLGRVLKQQGERDGAVAAYSQAVKSLKSIRSDLATISSDVQFSFRESVEPVYRELVSLLLQPGVETDQETLSQARQVIESLQVAELDNFFKDACLDTRPVQIDEIDAKAAVFYPIILPDRLEVIVKLPNQKLRRYTTFVAENEVEETLRKMREGLTRALTRQVLRVFLDPSQTVYNWLIRPIEQDLATSGAETLVFVLDGSLRNIPMAALHDGRQYLVQKYSLGVAPGLELVDAKPLARNQLKILTGGVSEARSGFDALPGVELELQRIASEVPTTKLLNESFTESNLKAAVKSSPYPVIHLATHGQFSSQAENTFILAWDERINAKQLDNLLRGDSKNPRPLELLVLSACRTAVGDRRAALGLAGVAVRAGARSTMASLWYVSDDATALLMTRFYEELTNTKVTKAEALRRAQQTIMQDEKFAHPYFWAAFVMVGNWL